MGTTCSSSSGSENACVTIMSEGDSITLGESGEANENDGASNCSDGEPSENALATCTDGGSSVVDDVEAPRARPPDRGGLGLPC